MRVLCSDAVQDPTKIEQYVRNQMAQRIKSASFLCFLFIEKSK
jgi:hypothetical protein